MQQRAAWSPDPREPGERGMVRDTVAADAAVLLVETAAFLRDVRSWYATDPEGFDVHWRVQRA